MAEKIKCMCDRALDIARTAIYQHGKFSSTKSFEQLDAFSVRCPGVDASSVNTGRPKLISESEYVRDIDRELVGAVHQPRIGGLC